VTILVTGATGRVGSRFVPRLLQQQARPVRVLARDPVRAEPLGRLGAEVVVGDLRDTATSTRPSRASTRSFTWPRRSAAPPTRKQSRSTPRQRARATIRGQCPA